MDARLITWARAVKARSRSPQPVLWLFTDSVRGKDPVAAAARLPGGISGIVFRHDGVPGRAALGRALARICRARRLALVVAGDTRLATALGAGVHLRGGRWPDPVRVSQRRLITSSAHGLAEIRRARAAGAKIVFLSPIFATASHPGAAALGPVRWNALARHGQGASQGVSLVALGGLTGASARRLKVASRPGRFCAGAGAIGALAGPLGG
jgi:thiamine-phosphate pyrophosphorylase